MDVARPPTPALGEGELASARATSAAPIRRDACPKCGHLTPTTTAAEDPVGWEACCSLATGAWETLLRALGMHWDEGPEGDDAVAIAGVDRECLKEAWPELAHRTHHAVAQAWAALVHTPKGRKRLHFGLAYALVGISMYMTMRLANRLRAKESEAASLLVEVLRLQEIVASHQQGVPILRTSVLNGARGLNYTPSFF